MTIGYEVVVDEREHVVFPAKCVVCGKLREGPSVSVQGNPVGYFGMWKWQFGLNQKIALPAHPGCGAQLKKGILWRQMALVAGAILALTAAIYSDSGRVGAVGLSLVLLIPPILWQIHNPLPIEFLVSRGKIEFTFKDHSYADEFAALNDARISG